MRGYWLLKEMKWLQVMRIPLGVTGRLQEKQVKREICNPRSHYSRCGLQEKQVMREICNPRSHYSRCGLQEKQVMREICNPRSHYSRCVLQEKQVKREICNLSEMTRKNRSRAMAAKIERGFRIIKEIIKEIINDKISI